MAQHAVPLGMKFGKCLDSPTNPTVFTHTVGFIFIYTAILYTMNKIKKERTAYTVF